MLTAANIITAVFANKQKKKVQDILNWDIGFSLWKFHIFDSAWKIASRELTHMSGQDWKMCTCESCFNITKFWWILETLKNVLFFFPHHDFAL